MLKIVTLRRLALILAADTDDSTPSLFQELRKSFPDSLPSADNLKFSLIKRGFTPDAAEKAAKNYLSTMSLVSGVPDSYNPTDDDEETSDDEAMVRAIHTYT